jgi:hypothetical protein
MTHEIVEGWTLEVRDADTLRLEFVKHCQSHAEAQDESQWWCDGYTTRIYCNRAFIGTREV